MTDKYGDNVETAEQGRPPMGSAGGYSSPNVAKGSAGCGMVMALIILIFSAFCLWDETKDAHYFSQDITIVASIGGWYASVGGYKTQFGWRKLCFKYDGAGEWTCSKWGQVNEGELAMQGYSFEDTGHIATLGKMTFVFHAISVALASLYLLSGCAQMKAGGSPHAANGFLCIGLLMFLYGFSVIVVSFPVLVKDFLDSAEKETNIEVNSWLQVRWAWVLSLINTFLWAAIGCAAKGGEIGFD